MRAVGRFQQIVLLAGVGLSMLTVCTGCRPLAHLFRGPSGDLTSPSVLALADRSAPQPGPVETSADSESTSDARSTVSARYPSGDSAPDNAGVGDNGPSPASAAPASAAEPTAQMQAMFLTALEELHQVDPAIHAELVAGLDMRGQSVARIKPELLAQLTATVRHLVKQRQPAETLSSTSTTNDQPSQIASTITQRLNTLTQRDPRPMDPAPPAPSPGDVIPTNFQTQVSTSVDPSEDWKTELARTINSLEASIAARDAGVGGVSGLGGEALRLKQRLHMLYTAAGRHDDAVRPIDGLDKPLQQFWSHEMFGLSVWLDDERMHDPARRAAVAKQWLTTASTHLGHVAALAIENLTFCQKVDGRGVFVPFDKDEFRRNQHVLIYAELENFVTETTPTGHRVRVCGTCQIYNMAGDLVKDYPPATTEKTFNDGSGGLHVIYNFVIPDSLGLGPYRLRLRIEDLGSGKMDERDVDFRVMQ